METYEDLVEYWERQSKLKDKTISELQNKCKELEEEVERLKEHRKQEIHNAIVCAKRYDIK